MNELGSRRSRVLVGLVAAVCIFVVTTAARAGTGPTITVEPAEGAPVGAEVTVSGEGFAPGESVTVTYVGETFGPVFADDAGAFALEFVMPDAPLGPHPLDADGDAGSVASVDFPVLAPPPTEAPSPTEAPVPGPPPSTPDTTVTGAPPTAVAPPASAPATTTAPDTDATDAPDTTTAATTQDEDSDDGSSLPIPLLVIGTVVLLVAVAAGIRIWASPRRAVPVGCHDLAEKLERLRRWRKRLADHMDDWERDAADRRAKADRFRDQNRRVIDAEKAAAASATSGSTPTTWRSERLDEEARQAEDMRDQGAASLKVTDDQITQLERELEECIKNPPSAPPPAASAPPAEAAGCCPGGTWVGLFVVNGGVVGMGASGGFVFLWCIDDFDRSAVLRFTGVRLGPAIGGEFSAVSLVGITGVAHPRDLAPAVSDVLDGFDWDLSVGAPLGRIARAGKGVSKRGFWKALIDHLSDVGKEVPSTLGRGDGKLAKELLKEGVGKAGAKSATNELESLAQGEPGATFALPLAIGLQAGFWHLQITQMDLVSFDGCRVCGSETVRVRGF